MVSREQRIEVVVYNYFMHAIDATRVGYYISTLYIPPISPAKNRCHVLLGVESSVVVETPAKKFLN